MSSLTLRGEGGRTCGGAFGATASLGADGEVLEIVAVDDDARVAEDPVLDPLALRVDDGEQPVGIHLRREGAGSSGLRSRCGSSRVREPPSAPFATP